MGGEERRGEERRGEERRGGGEVQNLRPSHEEGLDNLGHGHRLLERSEAGVGARLPPEGRAALVGCGTTSVYYIYIYIYTYIYIYIYVYTHINGVNTNGAAAVTPQHGQSTHRSSLRDRGLLHQQRQDGGDVVGRRAVHVPLEAHLLLFVFVCYFLNV